MRFDRNILSLTFLIAALTWTLWFVFAGFGNHQDPLYWLYKYEQLEGGWMAAGTLLAGGAIVRLFGAQLLPLRLAGWLCTVAAISLPYVCLLDKEQRRNNLHWLALTFLLMGYGAFQEFSPGTLTVLLLSAICVCVTQSSINRTSSIVQSSILTAVLVGLVVAVRFPNILVLLILIPLWRKRALWLVPIAAAAAGLVYLLGFWLITPAPLDAAMSSHEMMSMLTKLWEKSGLLLGYMLMAVGVLAFREKKYAGWFIGAAVALFILYTIKPTQWYNFDLTYLISAFVLVIVLAQSSINRTLSIVQSSIMIVATLGTDTAWLKLFPAVLCLLPVALTQYKNLTERRFLFEVLVVLCAVVVVRFTTNSVGKTNLLEARTVSTVSPYRHIAITPAEEHQLLQYKADFDSLSTLHQTSHITHQTSNILSIGQENHLMRAVTGCEAARYNEFWSNIFDSVYTAKYQPIIEAEHPIVFCSFSPQFKTKPIYKDRESRLERMLLNAGYTAIDRSAYKYMIYVYDPKVQ